MKLDRSDKTVFVVQGVLILTGPAWHWSLHVVWGLATCVTVAGLFVRARTEQTQRENAIRRQEIEQMEVDNALHDIWFAAQFWALDGHEQYQLEQRLRREYAERGWDFSDRVWPPPRPEA